MIDGKRARIPTDVLNPVGRDEMRFKQNKSIPDRVLWFIRNGQLSLLKCDQYRIRIIAMHDSVST